MSLCPQAVVIFVAEAMDPSCCAVTTAVSALNCRKASAPELGLLSLAWVAVA